MKKVNLFISIHLLSMVFSSFYCLFPLSTSPIFYYYCCSIPLDCICFEPSPLMVLGPSVKEVIVSNSLSCLQSLEFGILHYLLILNQFRCLPWKAFVVFQDDVNYWLSDFSGRKLTILRKFYLFIFTVFWVCWWLVQGCFFVSFLENEAIFFDLWLFFVNTIFHYYGLRYWRLVWVCLIVHFIFNLRLCCRFRGHSLNQVVKRVVFWVWTVGFVPRNVSVFLPFWVFFWG